MCWHPFSSTHYSTRELLPLLNISSRQIYDSSFYIFMNGQGSCHWLWHSEGEVPSSRPPDVEDLPAEGEVQQRLLRKQRQHLPPPPNEEM